MVIGAERELLRRGYVEVNDVVGIVAGTRTSSGSTNFMRLHTVGDSVDGGSADSSAKSAKRKVANGKRGSTNGAKPTASRKTAATKR
jgi:pyruvate kinase